MNNLLTFQEFLELQKVEQATEPIVEVQTVQRKVSRLLSHSFTLNLQEPRNGLPGKCFVVKIHGDSKYVQRHLLWKLLFRGLLPLEWLVLYREFEYKLKEDPGNLKTQYLGLLLFLSNKTRKRLPDWKSSSRSVFKKLQDCSSLLSNSPRTSLLEDIIFELKVPKKGDNVENIFTSVIRDYYNKKPIPVNRIGVGYKDKGSLKQGYDEVPEPLQPFLPDSSVNLADFLRESLEKIGREFNLSPLRL